MKALFMAGLVVLILGVASFFVALPHAENHGVKIGDANVGITTHSSEKLPPAIGAVLIVGGIVMMVAGGRGK